MMMMGTGGVQEVQASGGVQEVQASGGVGRELLVAKRIVKNTIFIQWRGV
jgi:hypothetical protein